MRFRKPSVDRLTGQQLLDRARSLGIGISDIPGGTGDLAERLALAQFGEEWVREKIREKEREISERRSKSLKNAGIIVGIIAGVLTAVATLLGFIAHYGN